MGRPNQPECIKGRRYGRLTPLRRYGWTAPTRWLCICDCQELKVVLKHNLVTGNVKSCGCLQAGVFIPPERRAQ